MITENWKPIPGYEGWYEASTEGRIRVMKWCTPRWQHIQEKVVVLVPLLYKKGYLKHQFGSCARTRKPKRCYYHRIIFETFHGPIPEGLTVNHKDGDKKNNRPDNLELATHQEQREHARRLGLVHCDQLTPDAVRYIRATYDPSKRNKTHLARMFGVWPNAITSVLSGKSWRHVT